MASEPKKTDTTEAALEAVEKALIEDFDLDDTGAADDEAKQSASSESKPTATEDIDFELDIDDLENSLADAANDLREESAAQAEQAPSPAPRPRIPSAPSGSKPAPPPASGIRAANDENTTRLAGVLASMDKRPSQATNWIAAILSIAWIVIAGSYFFLGSQDGGEFATSSFSELLSKPSFMLLAAMTVIPVLLIWAFAIMVRRAQEMRTAASSMTEAAIRLLQPEQVASDSVAAIGSAVRREVAAIGDGMELALARASELEQLVQSEVNSLERSYSDSEIRLRGLVKELSSERGEILNHAEKLRESLTYTHSGLTSELDQVSGRIKLSIDEATSRMSDALNER
ncbi:MAG: hypothetical protein ACR2O0_15250, partial [Rhizobiaceae bacterium]